MLTWLNLYEPNKLSDLEKVERSKNKDFHNRHPSPEYDTLPSASMYSQLWSLSLTDTVTLTVLRPAGKGTQINNFQIGQRFGN